MDISKMVDDQRQWHAADQLSVRFDKVGVEVKIKYPAERFDLRHHMLKLRLIEHAAVARQAIETHPAHPAAVQLAMIRLCQIRIGMHHPEQPAIALGDSVQR